MGMSVDINQASIHTCFINIYELLANEVIVVMNQEYDTTLRLCWNEKESFCEILSVNTTPEGLKMS